MQLSRLLTSGTPLMFMSCPCVTGAQRVSLRYAPRRDKDPISPRPGVDVSKVSVSRLESNLLCGWTERSFDLLIPVFFSFAL